jgi:AraC-like DNA-binding protein
MNYQTFLPHPDLKSLVKCYWTLEIPSTVEPQRQRIIPDGCIEMIFILGDDIKRYTSESEFILQPRAMVLGQTIESFYVQPTGYVNSFAVRFYPYGFANFVKVPINHLVNKETPLALLFGQELSRDLEQKIIHSNGTEDRIQVIEDFLFNAFTDQRTIDSIVQTTIDALLLTKGSASINAILKDDLSKRRNLERKFTRQIGISPKQLGKVIRLQTALRLLLNKQSNSLTEIAYESEYFDQAHFNKDFKEFTGINPKNFLSDQQMLLSSLFYSAD